MARKVLAEGARLWTVTAVHKDGSTRSKTAQGRAKAQAIALAYEADETVTEWYADLRQDATNMLGL